MASSPPIHIYIYTPHIHWLPALPSLEAVIHVLAQHRVIWRGHFDFFRQEIEEGASTQDDKMVETWAWVMQVYGRHNPLVNGKVPIYKIYCNVKSVCIKLYKINIHAAKLTIKHIQSKKYFETLNIKI